MPTITRDQVTADVSLTANTETVVDVFAEPGLGTRGNDQVVVVTVTSGTAPVFVRTGTAAVTVGDARAVQVLPGVPAVLPLEVKPYGSGAWVSQPVRLISAAAAVVSVRRTVLSQVSRQPSPGADVSGELTLPGQTGEALPLLPGAAYFTYMIAAKNESVKSVRLRLLKPTGRTESLVKVGVYSVNASTRDLMLLGATANDPTMLSAAGYVTRNLASPIAKVAGSAYAVALLAVPASTPALPITTAARVAGATLPDSAVLADGTQASGSLPGLSDLPSTATAAAAATFSGGPAYQVHLLL